MTRRLLPVLVLVLVLVLCASRPAAAGPLEDALDTVRPEALRAHMAFLSDDLLEGRETGTRGYQLAANYVATQFELMGLAPAGDGDTYFQWIDFRATNEFPERCGFTLLHDGGETALEYPDDYLMGGDALRTHTEVTAPLVFVGYGVHAPEVGYDDYAGIDVAGKIVILMRGAPPTFPHNERAYHASGRNKSRAAAERGAVGMISFTHPDRAERRPWEFTVRSSRQRSMRGLGPDGEPWGVEPALRTGAYLSPAGREALFEPAPVSLDEALASLESGQPRSFDLGVSARMERESVHETLRSCNVAAVLEGSDPDLKDEYVVFTAHLDHLGTAPEPVDGDSVYNGAYDNASGTAVLLEAARVFASLPERPRRSLLFLAVTGEEKGLLGSEYFCTYPTVPAGGLVANVNLDMFLMLHPLEDVVAFGAEHSSLEGVVEEAAAEVGVEVTPDPVPEEVLFVRSDQYNFVREGVPSIFLVGGGKGGGATGVSPWGDWIVTRYHGLDDDMDQVFVWEAGLDFTRLNVLIGHAVAQADKRPAWNEGDFFGEKFAPDRAR